MLKRLLTIAFAIVAVAGLAGTSYAQYVYLDANGDGVWTAADKLNANGTPTVVDAWINTNHNKDGSLALCDTGDGDLGFWNSYAIDIGATGGTVSFTNFVNQKTAWGITCVGVGVDFLSNSTEMTACRATATSEPGGLQKMFTVTVTGASGNPSLQYLPLGNLSPNFTSFGTPCSGNDFDNTYKLGSDFFDNDGLSGAGGPNNAPTLTAPSTVNGSENSPVSVTANASDPDAGQLVTLTQTNNATFLTGPASVGPSSNPSITLSGTPNFNQAATYTINWSATDNAASPATSTVATSVVIANVDRPPTVTAPATASGNEGTLITFTVSASDPDGAPIGLLSAASSPATTGSTFTAGVGNTSGTFSWTPSNAQAGTYTVTFTAANNLTGTAATVITVANVDGSPVVTAPATASGAENALITYTVSAADPDGDAITSLTAASSPATTGSTFTAGAGNTSGTFSWTPTFTQAGSYAVTVTASNALSGSATTTVTVTNVDRAPTVTAPATASGPEGTLITFSISVNDPDGDAITSLTSTSTPTTPGSTFAFGGARTSATWSWTPTFTNAGTYSVDFAASNALSGTARTTVTVTNVDRAPTVTAPATASGNETANITFGVTANDPDGDAINSLTAASSPPATGSTFTVNPSNTLGTFSWTPSFTQAGSYTVTFTASNVLSGTAATAITVNNVDRPPTITAPGVANFQTGVPGSVSVAAADPDGQAITSLTEVSTPPTTGSSFFTAPGNTSGTFSWTPSLAQAGTYTLTFTASNTLSSSATTTLTVSVNDRPPAVTAPAAASGNENTLITYTVTASDPDGQAITSLTAAGSPVTTGSSFTAGAGNTSGTFSWTPSFSQAGTYTVTVTATNTLTGTAQTTVTVNNIDRAPVVTAPATQSVNEGVLLSIGVTASDPDGNPLTSLTETSSPATTGSTFTTGGSFSNGTFSWTPTFTQAGSYTLTFTSSNALTGTAQTALTVNDVDRAPVVSAPATQSVIATFPFSFTVTASDPDGQAITSLTAASSPATTGSSFTTNAGNTSGTFSWTPSNTQVGSYTVTFTASNAVSGTAATVITVSPFDGAPVVTAPATASGAENTLITFTVTASDPDGNAITSLTAVSSPATTGSTFTVNASRTSGTWAWTPGFNNAGTYSVDFTASNALVGTARTSVTVTNVDRAPVVTAPATVLGLENDPMSFQVTASDPDGDAINTLTAASSPATTGSTFTVNASHNLASFQWTPSLTQAGTYTVTFFASNALTGTASTTITVENRDRAPVVTAPATQFVVEGNLLTFTVTAIDPDGDPLTSLTASSSPATTGSSFTTNGANTSGTFSWIPTNTQAGSYTVTFTASDGTLTAVGITSIAVANFQQNPTVTAPASQTADEGVLVTFTVTATDPDGDHVTLTMLAGSPTGSSFTDNGDNTGAFDWTPGFNQAGSYSVTFHGNDGNGGTADATTAITVNNVDRAPVADAGGPYSGVQNFPLQFHGSGSSDPDGDALSYMWDFGDGGSSTEPDPVHTYAMSGVYPVTLTVSSGSPVLSDMDATSATIQDHLPARAFTSGGNNRTSLGAGKPFTCFQVEPVGGAYDNSNVILSSIRMIYPVGSSNQIFVSGSKTGLSGDKDGNGITEITACFGKADLRVLFAGLPAGNNTVTIEIQGDLAGGGSFSATLTHVVKSSGGALVASISPNPLNPRALLSFSTTKPGAIRVQMFDPRGRLVKTIADEPVAMAGYHDYTIDGRSATGSKLASGVYFVKVWSEHDGDEVKRITILK